MKMPYESVPVLIAVIALFATFMSGLAWGLWRSSLGGTWAEEQAKNTPANK
jgi:hypothetical protein